MIVCTEFVVKVPEKLRCIWKQYCWWKTSCRKLRLVVYVPLFAIWKKYLPYSSSRDLVLDPSVTFLGLKWSLFGETSSVTLKKLVQWWNTMKLTGRTIIGAHRTKMDEHSIRSLPFGSRRLIFRGEHFSFRECNQHIMTIAVFHPGFPILWGWTCPCDWGGSRVGLRVVQVCMFVWSQLPFLYAHCIRIPYYRWILSPI